MSIRTIDPLLSQELASKPKTCTKSKVARYLTKDLIDVLAQPEPIKQYAQMKEKISSLKKKSMHAEVAKLRIIEEQKIKSDLNPKLTNSSLNCKSYYDPLSFLNEHGITINSSIPEHLKSDAFPNQKLNEYGMKTNSSKPDHGQGDALQKPSVVTNQSLNDSKSIFPFEKVEAAGSREYKGNKPNTMNADKNFVKHSEIKMSEIQDKVSDSANRKPLSPHESKRLSWGKGPYKHNIEENNGIEKNQTEKSVDSKMRPHNFKGHGNVEMVADNKNETKRPESEKRYKNGVDQYNGYKKTRKEKSFHNNYRYQDEGKNNKSHSGRDFYNNRNDYSQQDKRSFQCESSNSRSGSSFAFNKNPNFRNDSRSFSKGPYDSKYQTRTADRNNKYNDYPTEPNETCQGKTNGNFVSEKNYNKNFETKGSYSGNRLRNPQQRPGRSDGLCSSEKLNDSKNFVNKSFSNSSGEFVDLKSKKITDDQKDEHKVAETSSRKSVKFQEMPLNSIKKPNHLQEPEPRSQIFNHYLKTTLSDPKVSNPNVPDSKAANTAHFNNFEQVSDSEPENFSQESIFSFNPNSKSGKSCETKPLEANLSQITEESLKFKCGKNSKDETRELAVETYQNKCDLPLKRDLDKREDFFEKKKKIGEGTERELECSKVKKRWEDNEKQNRGSFGGKRKNEFLGCGKSNDRKKKCFKSKRKSYGRRESEVKREGPDLFGKEQRNWSKVDGIDGSDSRMANESTGKANRYCIHN